MTTTDARADYRAAEAWVRVCEAKDDGSPLAASRLEGAYRRLERADAALTAAEAQETVG